MSILGKLFGRQRSRPNFPPEVAKILEKIERFLIDDDAQNAALPEPVRKAIEQGPAVDKLPGATGEFGRCATNPIPVNGPLGEVSYLSSLVTPSGAGLFGHRVGHIDKIDVYETVSTDGKIWDVLFLSYYHPRKSRNTPAGYSFARSGERPAFVTCTNFRVDGFPFPMEAAIKECMRRVLGIPIRPPNVAELLTSARFVRTPIQNSRLAELPSLGLVPTASYKEAGD